MTPIEPNPDRLRKILEDIQENHGDTTVHLDAEWAFRVQHEGAQWSKDIFKEFEKKMAR